MLSVEKITLTCVDFGPLRAYAVTQFFRPVFCLRIEALSKPGLISSCMWSVYIEEYMLNWPYLFLNFSLQYSVSYDTKLLVAKRTKY